MTISASTPTMPADEIVQSIPVLRGHRVILDSELAALYGVSSKRFNEQVRRNRERFPADFMFQLTIEELAALRSQIATLKRGRGQHRKYLPYAFTEHGAIMAATVLNSPRAVEMSVYVVRAFVHLRELLSSNRELALRFGRRRPSIHRLVTGVKRVARQVIDANEEYRAVDDVRAHGCNGKAQFGIRVGDSRPLTALRAGGS